MIGKSSKLKQVLGNFIGLVILYYCCMHQRDNVLRCGDIKFHLPSDLVHQFLFSILVLFLKSILFQQDMAGYLEGCRFGFLPKINNEINDTRNSTCSKLQVEEPHFSPWPLSANFGRVICNLLTNFCGSTFLLYLVGLSRTQFCYLKKPPCFVIIQIEPLVLYCLLQR